MRQWEPVCALQANGYSSGGQSLFRRHSAPERCSTRKPKLPVLFDRFSLPHLPSNCNSFPRFLHKGTPPAHKLNRGVHFMDIPRDSRTLVLAAVILACVLSKGRTETEMAQLAAFLTVAGDALALLSLQPDCEPDNLTD